VDINTNPDHCGDCTTSCATVANADRVCKAKVCDFVCIGTYKDCDGQKDNGCEANTASDPAACGPSCTNCMQVAAPPNMVAGCGSGACQFTCEPGFYNCDMNQTNGCECTSGCSGTACFTSPPDSGFDSGICTPEGAQCSLPTAKCCVGLCGQPPLTPDTVCCLPSGSQCGPNSTCCSGLCPLAMGPGGLDGSSTLGQCP
jgi:hypothetical protein